MIAEVQNLARRLVVPCHHHHLSVAAQKKSVFATARQLHLADVLRAAQHRCRSARSEEHTSELQSLRHLVCRLLLEKKNNKREINPLTLYRSSLGRHHRPQPATRFTDT